MTDESRFPRVVFAGGGTGGHLYPALAVADELRKLNPDLQFVFFGSDRAIDQKILQTRLVTFIPQSLQPLSGKPWRWPGIWRAIAKARKDCHTAFVADRPLAVVGTGGLASVPAVLQAAAMGIPTGLINPDVVPGKANRFLSGRVDRVFAQFTDSTRYFPGKAQVDVCGCPVRAEFLSARREEGVVRFGLDAQRKTLLVTGASQGARTINDAVMANADFFADRKGWQILHLTGDADYERVRTAYQCHGTRAVVIAYTEHMAEALAAADLVISRAGASTLAELTAVGRASILLPYPFHRDQHQAINARCLEKAGAAIMLKDERTLQINGPALRRIFAEHLNDAAKIAAMGNAARRLGHPQAATHMAAALLQMAAENGISGHADSLQRSCSLAR